MTDSFASLAIIAATFFGPIAAVQVQKVLERGRDEKNRRLHVFRTLMATRATNTSSAHVEALNAVPLEFTRKRYEAVYDAWQTYYEHLGATAMPGELWGTRRVELFIDLLLNMSKVVGYKLSRMEIQRGAYLPTGHQKVEQDQEAIRIAILELLQGKRPLLVAPPATPTPADNVTRIQSAGGGNTAS